MEITNLQADMGGGCRVDIRVSTGGSQWLDNLAFETLLYKHEDRKV